MDIVKAFSVIKKSSWNLLLKKMLNCKSSLRAFFQSFLWWRYARKYNLKNFFHPYRRTKHNLEDHLMTSMSRLAMPETRETEIKRQKPTTNISGVLWSFQTQLLIVGFWFTRQFLLKIIANAVFHFSRNLELTEFGLWIKKLVRKMMKTLRIRKFLFYFDLDTGGLIIGYLYFCLSGMLCIFTAGAAYYDSLNNKLFVIAPLIFLIIAVASYFLIDGTVVVSICPRKTEHDCSTHCRKTPRSWSPS